jgi:hypothetical protein
MTEEEFDYLSALERENAAMVTVLARMSRRNQDLTEQRNTYFRKCAELQREIDRSKNWYGAV